LFCSILPLQSEKHEISPEEKAFRKKFNKVLEELKKEVPVKEVGDDLLSAEFRNNTFPLKILSYISRNR
jgi:hypothetical protein